MFKVNSKFQFIHHYASSKAIADAVRDDLANRECCEHPEQVVVESCDDVAQWDPGGSLWIGDKKHIFSLNNINIEVYLQHINWLPMWIVHAKKQLRELHGTKYYKIHSGYLFCVCISPDELEQLIKQLNSPELIFKASSSEEERNSRCASAGILQVAKTKDLEGNERIAVIKPKKQTLN